MKKSASLLACLISVCGVSAASDLCIQGESRSLQMPDSPLVPYFLTLTVANLGKGHVQLFGSHCYESKNNEVGALVKDCMPTAGAGILYEDKIELSLTSSENHADLGYGLLSIIISHVSIDRDTYKGRVAFEINNNVLTAQGADYSRNHVGTVKIVACPAKTKADDQSDKTFKKTINEMTRIK
jgi:hypothetical protein